MFLREQIADITERRDLEVLTADSCGYNPGISGLMKSAGRNFRVNLVSWEKILEMLVKLCQKSLQNGAQFVFWVEIIKNNYFSLKNISKLQFIKSKLFNAKN